jgi:hypothetical protein
LELVPYIVEIVPKHVKMRTGASNCSDAKFSPPNKILFLSQLAPVEPLDFNHLEERRHLLTRFWGPGYTYLVIAML